MNEKVKKLVLHGLLFVIGLALIWIGSHDTMGVQLLDRITLVVGVVLMLSAFFTFQYWIRQLKRQEKDETKR